MTTVADHDVAAEHVARTRALIPELRARAEQTASDRRVPVENIRALQQAGSLKTIQSTRNGGYGLGVRTHIDIISSLARGCGSTAWVAGVVHAHSWLLSHFPAAAQDDAYGADPNTVVSAVIGPRGRAKRTPDGYRLSGVWPFASGCERSQWLLLGGVVVDADGNEIDEGDWLVPTAAATIKDDWYAAGLTGTGSCTVMVDELYIPEHRFLSLPGLIRGQSPGAPLYTDWVQRCAPVPLLTIALCGGSIGIARQALEDYPPLVRGKVIAYSSDDQEQHPLTHIQLADAAMRVEEAELLLYRCADEIDDAGRAGVLPDLLTRARQRMDCAQAVRRALEAVEILFKASGASGVRTASPLCRALADLQAINNHGLVKLETNQQMYGRLLMGLEPNTRLI
jgi:3-hydroxy-9,10-secoandrosta-1,3,5(10)-triene-9,17-dione monooxygenase